MPYIPQADREDTVLNGAVNVGGLTYALTAVIIEYIEGSMQERDEATPRFRDFAEVLGALEATKLEFYRRIVAQYEHTKQIRNGDVYPRSLGGWAE